MKVKYDVYIGIDPGVKTGLAAWSVIGKVFIYLETDSIISTMSYFNGFVYMDKIFVYLEDARLRTWIPRQKNEKAERGRAAGAGSVKRDCQIWEEFLKSRGIPYELVAPKHNKTKLDSETFKKYTGYTGKTDQHGRDAGMLVFGR